MSISTDWLPVQSTLTPPSVDCVLTVDLALGYLGATGVPSFDVIAAVKSAVAGLVNESDGTLSFNALVAVALAVPGVSGVRRATLNGDVMDITAASFTTRPEYVGVNVATIR